jgi:hypothetical protein
MCNVSQGGIGKTVTAVWLARHDEIRRHFELVVWVTLGQTPDLARMQALIYLQVTGEELAADATPEQAKEKITVALRGRIVLLILDDIWEEEHSAALDFIDTATASKTLVTTRIRGLGGAAQVELGVPSEEESVKLLLASAGLAHVSPVPAEAAEVAQICGRLPLAVDLAGKMLRDLGVGGSDWAGIPKLLREEMKTGADGDETTVEYRVIAASLSAIPLRDRADAQKVFSVFALVAEDTFVPLSAFRILLSAVTGEAELVPELQLRRWLQVLINRSICLGTWERPQLHDSKCLLNHLSRSATKAETLLLDPLRLLCLASRAGICDCDALARGLAAAAAEGGGCVRGAPPSLSPASNGWAKNVAGTGY